MPNYFKILPNWQNFAKSGHTGRKPTYKKEQDESVARKGQTDSERQLTDTIENIGLEIDKEREKRERQ